MSHPSQNTIDEWNIIFRIVGIIYFVSAVIFMLFSSVEIQSWNNDDDDSNDVDKRFAVDKVEGVEKNIVQ